MERYEAALDHNQGTTEERLATCLALEDPDMAGDCSHGVVMGAVTRGAGDPTVLCPLVPAGLWQAECWFETAEVTARKSRQRAVDLCDRAEPFVDDCHQHLWQGQLKAMVDRSGADGFAPLLESAQAMHDRWAALVPDDPEHTFRFWRRFYQAGLGPMTPLDLGACDPLPDLHRERCLDAGVAGWLGHLEQAMLDAKKEAVICTADPEGDLVHQFALIGPPVTANPHPRLELAAAEFQQDSCMRMAQGSQDP